jgi:hypothetical protein
MSIKSILIIGLLAQLAAAQTPETDEAVAGMRKTIQEQESKRVNGPVDSKADIGTEEEIEKPIAASMVETDQSVDAFVSNSVSPGHLDRKVTEKRIRAILGYKADAQENQYEGVPYVFISNAGGEQFLLIGYELSSWRMGDSEVTLRAYKSDGHHFSLTAQTGSKTDTELVGDSLLLRKLPSPVAGETWLLAWGERAGSNGPGNYTICLYAYDGNKFRTVWKQNVWGLKLSLTQDGFTVMHEVTIGQFERRIKGDEYSLTPEGPKLIGQEFVGPDEYQAVPDVPSQP